MGRILPFERPSDGYEDMEELLREFYAEERKERECEWLEEAVRRAKEILLTGPQRASLCRRRAAHALARVLAGRLS